MITLTEKEIQEIINKFGLKNEITLKILDMNTLTRVVSNIIKNDSNYVETSFGANENSIYIDGQTEYSSHAEKTIVKKIVDNIIEDNDKYYKDFIEEINNGYSGDFNVDVNTDIDGTEISKMNIKYKVIKEKDKMAKKKEMKVQLLKLNEPTKSGIIYREYLIKEKVINDPIVKEQLQNHCLFIFDGIVADIIKVVAVINNLYIEDNYLVADIELLDTECGNKVSKNIDNYEFSIYGWGSIEDNVCTDFESVVFYVKEKN